MAGFEDKKSLDSTSNRDPFNVSRSMSDMVVRSASPTEHMRQDPGGTPGDNDDTAVPTIPPMEYIGQDPSEIIGDDDDVLTPPVPAIEHTTGHEDTPQISSSYNDLVINVDNRIITAKGNARLNAIESSLDKLDNGIMYVKYVATCHMKKRTL